MKYILTFYLIMIQLCLFSCGPLVDSSMSETPALIITGQGTDDWIGYDALAMDPAKDVEPGSIDLQQLKASSQNGWLLLNFEMAEEIVLQRGNRLTLLIDGDADPATGWITNGMGAEFSWVFGERQGFFYSSGGSADPIDQTDFTLRAAPTFSAKEFEVAIRLDAAFIDGSMLFSGNEVDLAVWDQQDGGDRIPENGAVSTAVYPSPSVPVLPIPIERDDPSHFRILQHNVLEDGILKRPDVFGRIYQAIAPDLLLLGEVYEAQPAEILELLGSWFPIDTVGQGWMAIRHQDGSMVVSRHPIRMLERSIEGTADGFMLTLPAPWQTQLLVVHGYAMCCDYDSLRQVHCDQIMANIRDWTRNGSVPLETPIVLAGDFNQVTWRQSYETLRTGSIQDTTRFGPAFKPDGGQASFTDLHPRSLAQAMDYTWRNDSMSFSPGRLDMLFYTGSNLRVGTRFVFDDEGLSDSLLEQYELQRGDFSRAADHRPVVADFYPFEE